MNSLENFIKNTKGLTRNPLGIIGLFISLIYGFSCLVLSTSISNLNTSTERLPLIWFVIIFPIIILAAFIYLVVNHHEKLYAPGDFRDDNAFIVAMSHKNITEKKQDETKLLSLARKEEGDGNKNNGLSTPQIPETNDTSSKTSTLEKDDLTERLDNSQNWAIKELTLNYNQSFKINQILATASGRRLELDAFSTGSTKVIIAEVKYWQSKRSIKPLLLSIQEFVIKLDSFKNAFGNKKIELALVIVFDEVTSQNTKEIESHISRLHKNVKLFIKEYSQLEKEYQ